MPQWFHVTGDLNVDLIWCSRIRQCDIHVQLCAVMYTASTLETALFFFFYLMWISECFSQHLFNIPHDGYFLMSPQRVFYPLRCGGTLEVHVIAEQSWTDMWWQYTTYFKVTVHTLYQKFTVIVTPPFSSDSMWCHLKTEEKYNQLNPVNWMC